MMFIRFFLISFLISFLSYAEESKIIVINKAQEAPYEGILLNKEATISIKVEFDLMNNKCNISLDTQKELQKANCSYEKEILFNHYEKEKTDLNINLSSLNNEIELYKNKIKVAQEDANKQFWSGTFIGVAGGILITSIIGLTIYIIK